ncbi:hypothetical protein DQ04_24411000, partial [Trypanosoma grayi]|uniref:hypothetical protein n=1 Tax=Trypanosoma grayi TaxID=71804 RepID=UPI0004F405E3
RSLRVLATISATPPPSPTRALWRSSSKVGGGYRCDEILASLCAVPFLLLKRFPVGKGKPTGGGSVWGSYSEQMESDKKRDAEKKTTVRSSVLCAFPCI